jgi:excisionase family DNA binding protein
MSGDVAPIPRVALSREEAAAALGVSIDTLERHIQPSLRIIRVGRLRLIPVTELARWWEQHAEHTIQPRRAA